MSDTQYQRLHQIVELLLDHPEGLSTNEIAEYFGITRQTALRNINTLSAIGYPIIEIEGGHEKYTISRIDYLKNVHLTLAQAWFMYLPLRRIVRANLHRYSLVRSLLHRVTTLLYEEIADPLIPDESESPNKYDEIFAKLVQAWHERCYVQIHYKALNSDRPSNFVVAPWWFEPAVWSDAFYLIAEVKQTEPRLTTLKLDRIHAVQLTKEQFERPQGKDIVAKVASAWGIWMGAEDTKVVLRFNNRQFDRLKETRWHPSEKVTLDSQGAVLWEAYVSEPQEMLPWIRGWGADVEVIAPDNIRQQIANEAEATFRLYKPSNPKPRDFF